MLSFGPGDPAGGFVSEPPAGWPAEGPAFYCSLPFGALDAVLGVLRDGDPPIRLQVYGKVGDFGLSLSTYSKTRVASDDV